VANKKIELAVDFPYIEIIKPAKNYVPEWYGKTKQFLGDKTKPALRNCVPFLDSFLTGYMVVTFCDLIVDQTVHGPIIRWPGQTVDVPDFWEPLQARGPEISYPMPSPNGYHEKHFVWNNPHLIKTPKDYSILITQPLNQYDLPFFTLSGVIDTDKDLLSSGRIPFFVKKGFEGVVPKGTPIYQVIPIKRDSWETVENMSLREDNRRRMWQVGSVINGWYKKNLWSKKEYN
jgi:hypothetical protein